MRFRKAEISDALGIAKVHVVTWKTAYKGKISDQYLESLDYIRGERQWKERLENHEIKQFFYVAENELKDIIGFAVGGLEQFKPNLADSMTSKYEGELLAIYILEDYQRKGIGTRLVLKVVKNLLDHGISSMLVWVLKESKYSGFYEKLGGKYLTESFKEIGGDKYRLVSYGWEDIKQIATKE